MIKLHHLWTTIFLSVFLLCTCTKAQNDVKHVWIAREDHGDKPGVEYRVWLTKENCLAGEMWLFTRDEYDKEKERGKFPTTIKTSDQKQITFNCKSGDGSEDEFTIRFPNGLLNRQEQAVLEFGKSQTKRELKFERSDK